MEILPFAVSLFVQQQSVSHFLMISKSCQTKFNMISKQDAERYDIQASKFMSQFPACTDVSPAPSRSSGQRPLAGPQ